VLPAGRGGRWPRAWQLVLRKLVENAEPGQGLPSGARYVVGGTRGFPILGNRGGWGASRGLRQDLKLSPKAFIRPFPECRGLPRNYNNILERIRNISRISTALAITRKVLGIISLKAHEALITAHHHGASLGPSLALESPSPCPVALRPCSPLFGFFLSFSP